MVLAIVLFGWLVLSIAPETPIGRALHRWMVARPAAWLNRFHRGHVLLTLIVMAAMGAALLLEGDAPRLLSLALPDFLSWAVMFDVSALLDAAVATLLIAGSIRWSAVRARLPGRRPTVRTAKPRRRRTRVARKPAANDDEGPGRVLAA